MKKKILITYMHKRTGKRNEPPEFHIKQFIDFCINKNERAHRNLQLITIISHSKHGIIRQHIKKL